MKYATLDIAFKKRSHAIFKTILDSFASSAHPMILDVGCAFGVIGALRKDPLNIIGIERDPDLLRAASKNCQKIYSLDLDKFDKTSIDEKDFDFIFCGDVVEHVLDPQKLLMQLGDHLAPKGYLVVSVPNIAQVFYRFKLLFGNFDYEETGVLDKTHLHLYTYKTARALLETAGFDVIRFYPSGTLASFINLWPFLLASQFVFLCRKKLNASME